MILHSPDDSGGGTPGGSGASGTPNPGTPSPTPSNPPPDEPPPPPPTRAGRGSALTLIVYLLTLAVVLLYTLVVLWPHPAPNITSSDPSKLAAKSAPHDSTGASNPSRENPSPLDSTIGRDSSLHSNPGPDTAAREPFTGSADTTDSSRRGSAVSGANPNRAQLDTAVQDPNTIVYFWRPYTIFDETRLLLIVIVAGALGSLVHGIRSVFWYIGSRKLMTSWLAMYYLLPVSGAILAVLFYVVIRGGFFSSDANYRSTSPFSFAALGALVGMFSQPAVLKMQALAETLFTKPPAGTDAKPQR